MPTWYSKAQADTLLAGKDASGAAAAAQAAATAAAATDATTKVNAATTASALDAATATNVASGAQTSAALRAAFDARYGRADPVLSNFSYDATTGNLLSYQEDGITITMTYNTDGTVATSQRGTDAAQTYTYSGGNLVGVA